MYSIKKNKTTKFSKKIQMVFSYRNPMNETDDGLQSLFLMMS